MSNAEKPSSRPDAGTLGSSFAVSLAGSLLLAPLKISVNSKEAAGWTGDFSAADGGEGFGRRGAAKLGYLWGWTMSPCERKKACC